VTVLDRARTNPRDDPTGAHRLGRTVGATLVACVREHDWERWPERATVPSPAGQRRLFDAACAHRVVPAVYQSLRHAAGADPAVLAALSATYNDTRRAQLAGRADLLRVRDLLDHIRVPWVIVKGPVMSEHAYGRRGLRRYYDLDVVVPRRAFALVATELERAGYPIVDKDWHAATAELAGEIELRCPFGTPLDLHWDLLYHAALRARFALPLDELLERRRSVELAGAEFPTLDRADTLIHLAVHGFREGGGRLQWLKDIEQVVLYDTPPWSDVVRRAHDWNLAPVVGSMLDRTRRLLDAPVPAAVVDELTPRPWRSALRAADRVAPIERGAGRSTIATLVMRSTRGSTGASIRAFVENALTRRRRGLRPDGDDATRPPAPPDPAGRARFFAAVSGDGLSAVHG
jgi:hypothetical protein